MRVSLVRDWHSRPAITLPNVFSILHPERDDFRKLSSSCPTTLCLQILSQWEGESIEIFTWGVLAMCWVESVG